MRGMSRSYNAQKKGAFLYEGGATALYRHTGRSPACVEDAGVRVGGADTELLCALRKEAGCAPCA